MGAKKPKDFEDWYERFNKVCLKGSSDPRPREELFLELYEHISPFVCVTQGVNNPEEQNLTPEARMRSLIEKRRRKVTNRLASKIIWAPGTLLCLRNFLHNSFTYFSWSKNKNEYKFKHGFFLVNDDEPQMPQIQIIKSKHSGFYTPNTPAQKVPKEILDNTTLSQKENGRVESKAYGVVIDELLLCGEEPFIGYFWIRIVKILVNSRILAFMFHPNLPKEELSSVASSVSAAANIVDDKKTKKKKSRIPGKRAYSSTIFYYQQ